ncbi:M61 family metallopeptidase [Shewanella intestini]|uniref:M61 family metallopeptidase n=1 Tax=Shewanella intestini TaxID=2017544 RepID=A0ABS5HYI6_9GAMM|nr:MULTISPECIES: PDZ domain-containing protein [Shewanella]MBR9726777.1 M61 family metallopeptidase [Shewanella intestini]MRG34657.1 PDZ domain-containing protein [Shewanella sp. XMDDZSB0408]
MGSAWISPAMAQVNYHIDLTTPEHHSASVSVAFPETKNNQLVVNLPVWRTGKYDILPTADGVRAFRATDSKGRELPWTRSASGEWTVNLSKPTQVNVSYRLHANELGVRLRHIDASHAFLDASGVFMYSPEFRQDDITVAMDVPKSWRSFSGMESGKHPHSFKAANYDVLVDSPIETGINQHFSFKADGRDYEVVFWGEGNYDTSQIVEDLKKISGQAHVIWDDYPFERYVYMVHATSGASGATEHLNSTIIQLPRFMFRERDDYLRFISTASHEFIHTWNVKAYRPQGLVPYDYQSENMTSLLWISEGSTSYFQNQLLLRAGVITAKEYLADLAKRVARNLHTPGREVQSIAESSLGQWTNTFGDYAINHSVSIYSEGYITSMALDLQLLNDTKLAHSYRDVHRKLYQDFKLPIGFTVDDVKGILAGLTGRDYQKWWQENVDTPKSHDFDGLLAQAGLKTHYADDKQTIDVGITLSSAHHDLSINHVRKGSPAWNAGIVAGDEVVAVNGLKVTAPGFTKRLEDFNSGDKISLTVFKNDQLTPIEVEVQSVPKGKLTITAVDKPSAEQKAFLKAWLGIDWPFDDKGKFINKEDD